MIDLSSVRVLPGSYGTWLTKSGTAVLVEPDTDLDHPSEDLGSSLQEWLGANEEPRPYGVTVTMTTRCNLSCEYCFQNTVDAHGVLGRIAEVGLRTDDIADVSAFVARQVEQLGKPGVDVLLTGGEPLLSYRACADLLERLQPIGIHAAQMFTNATLMTKARIERLAAAGLTDIQVTVDGWRTDHDRYRVDVAKRGTFDRVVDGIVEVLSAAPDVDVTVRVNVTSANVERLQRLVRHLAAELDAERLTFRFGLVDDTGVGFADAPDPTAIGPGLREAMLNAVDLGFAVEPLASVGDCVYCGETGGTSGCVINCDGVLYSCWESVGQAGMAVGDIHAGYADASLLAERWVDCAYNTSLTADQRAAHEQLCADLDSAVLDRLYERSLLAEAS